MYSTGFALIVSMLPGNGACSHSKSVGKHVQLHTLHIDTDEDLYFLAEFNCSMLDSIFV